jgi:hypothetical protein
MKKIRIIIFLALLLSVKVLISTEPNRVIILDNGLDEKNIGSMLYVLEDPDDKLTIDDVITPEFQKKFHLSNKKNINFGYTDSKYWFKFDLIDKIPQKKNWLIEITYPPLDNVEIYSFNRADSIWNVYRIGDNVPYSQRLVKHRNFIYKLDHEDNDLFTYYIKVGTEGSFQVPINIISIDKQISNSNIELLVGAFFGLMFIMAIYNLFIYFSLRDKNYLYYFLTISSMLFLQLSLRGFHVTYIFESLVNYTNIIVLFSMTLTLIFSNIFFIQFLNLKVNIKYMFYFSRAFIYIGLISIPAFFFIPYSYLVIFLPVCAVITAIHMLASGIYLWKKGNKYARYFVLAWAFYIIGVIFMYFKNAGLVPGNFIFTNSMEIGAVLQVLFISFALADKYSLIKNEQQKLIKKNLELEKEQTEKLKIAVDERTKELQFINEELSVSNSTKDKFLSIIAHDLRNPFTSLIGFGHLLEHNFEIYDREDIKNKINLINTTAKQTYSLLENLLKWANSQRGELPFEPKKFNLFEFVVDINHLLDKQAIHKHISINIEIPNNLTILADKNMLSTIFRNLISNAIKFTLNNGFVLIKAEEKSADRNVIISITDSGIGIAKK